MQCYPLGYFGAGIVHYAISYFFPPKELGKVDEADFFGTFGPREKMPFGVLVGVLPDDVEAGSGVSGNGEGEKRSVATSVRDTLA